MKETQGHKKMVRYIQDLIRNKNFKKNLKSLKRARKKEGDSPKGSYYIWSLDQRKKHDHVNDELISITNDFELLKKRCKKLLGIDFKEREIIAENYGLDNELLNCLMLTKEKKSKSNYYKYFFEKSIDIEMCRITNEYEEKLSPLNKGEDLIYIRPYKKLSTIAYPVAINIHPKASQRDVLDFIEKKWGSIEEQLRFANERPLLIKERKLKQDIVDFIWENQGLPVKKIKEKLDKNFPSNGIVYYEISKIISIEKKRRNKYIGL